MSFKKHLLAILCCPVFYFSLYARSGEKVAFIPTPEETKNTPVHFMRDLGEKADFLCNRIRFKISYSFYKSREYFRLAASAPKDSLPKHGRDLKSRLEIKKEEMHNRFSTLKEEAVNKGKEEFRKQTTEISGTLQRQKEAVSSQIQKTGNEVKKEAQREIRRQTDGLFQ